MSVPSSTIDTFRNRWADRFIDTVTITRVTDRGTFNDSTGVYDGGAGSTIYIGGGLIRPMSSTDKQQFGEQQVTGAMYDVLLPYDAGDFQIEDTVTIDATTHDVDLVGAVMLVMSTVLDSYQTHTILRCRHDLGAGFAV